MLGLSWRTDPLLFSLGFVGAAHHLSLSIAGASVGAAAVLGFRKCWCHQTPFVLQYFFFLCCILYFPASCSFSYIHSNILAVKKIVFCLCLDSFSFGILTCLNLVCGMEKWLNRWYLGGFVTCLCCLPILEGYGYYVVCVFYSCNQYWLSFLYLIVFTFYPWIQWKWFCTLFSIIKLNAVMRLVDKILKVCFCFFLYFAFFQLPLKGKWFLV